MQRRLGFPQTQLRAKGAKAVLFLTFCWALSLADLPCGSIFLSHIFLSYERPFRAAPYPPEKPKKTEPSRKKRKKNA